ncbi:MAG TPA: protein tyrosine phosphatase [Roseiarcus sp.]|nr:protein tyrosine phosphatase [Roseiarcus sp.]
MPRLHVCSLALIGDTVARTGARSLVTLMEPGTRVDRPARIAPERHLYLGVSDIVAPEPGRVLPEPAHLQDLLGFVHAWDRAEPMLIHCFAGVSRSTAAAFIAACALNPSRDEFAVARALRAASPTATPNARLVALADAALERNGRMNEAIAEIGRGEECFEGTPFVLELG